jgi:hypothetical protein
VKYVEGRGLCREGLARARLSSRHARRIVSFCSEVCGRSASERPPTVKATKGLVRCAEGGLVKASDCIGHVRG